MQVSQGFIRDSSHKNNNVTRDDFEGAVAYLLPTYPVVKKMRNRNKEPTGYIASTQGINLAFKSGKGAIRFDLRFYPYAKFVALRQD